MSALLRQHPRMVDGAIAALLACATGPVALRGASVAALLWFVAVHVPLVWRRRWPASVFLAVYGLAIVSGVLVGVRVEGLYPELPVTLAVYTAARYGRRRHLVPIVAAIEVPALVVFLIYRPQWTALGFVTTLLAATVLAGITVSTRQAYLSELEERARRLERERDQQAEVVAAAVRARIARDMHDIVAHNLTVIVALADGAALSTGTAPERAADAMRRVAATGREALTEMRRALGVLHEPEAGRAPQPGLADLDSLLSGVRAAGVRVALTIDGVPAECGPGAGLAVYRIVQEALTNTLKHAGPGAHARVGLRYADGRVDLCVTDDGGGITPARTTGGRGVAGMAERAAVYGGAVTAGPRDGAPGWKVHAFLRLDGAGA
jgi:signal transduction histidine kinase